MKKSNWWLIAAVCLLPLTAVGQVELNTIAGVGRLVGQDMAPATSIWVGGETPLSSSVAGGYSIVGRAGVFYADTPDDIQGASGFMLYKKTLGLWNDVGLYAGIGGGGLYEITDGEDNLDAAWKLELGVDVYKNFGLALGADYVPIPNGHDQWNLYALLDLTPRLK